MSQSKTQATANTGIPSKGFGSRKHGEKFAPLARYGVGGTTRPAYESAGKTAPKKTFVINRAVDTKPTVRQRMDLAASKPIVVVKKDDGSSAAQLDKLKQDILGLEAGLGEKQSQLDELQAAKQNMVITKVKYSKEEEDMQEKIKKVEKKNKESQDQTIARRTDIEQLLSKETTLKSKLEELSRFTR